jgi:hypothetical protein
MKTFLTGLLGARSIVLWDNDRCQLWRCGAIVFWIL